MPPKKQTSPSAVVTISSDVGSKCKHCDEFLGLNKFDFSVNHYIQAHGYRILHVGQQTSYDAESKPWQSTVAVLAK